MAGAQPLVDYNWNDNYRQDGIVHCHLTDFCLTQVASDGQSRSITSLLLANPGNAKQKYTLSGNLLNKDGPCIKKPFRLAVTSYYIDVGSVGSIAMDDPLRGFWMVGDDEDLRYKLVYPSAPEYIPYARILDLSLYSNLFGFYSHAHETGRCVRMTNFILTNRDSGSKQTLILPKNTKTVSVLKGTITINPESLAGTGLDVFIGNTDKERCKQLPMQTYINSTYVVDFGDSDDVKTVPILWVEDLYKTWIKLEAPCHRDYKSDYNVAMSRTINNVEAYNWDADGNEVWRHVTNFRLTTLTGQLHELEITAQNSVFILWGDLQPPTGSTCPPIPVKLYVTTFSVDTGTERHDVNMGIWMQERKGSWYKLDLPAAPDYKDIAAPVFTNATKFLELYDALFYQDEDGANWCPSDPDESKGFLLKWPIKQIHRACNPKFDLKWVAQNKDFVYNYLVNDFNLGDSLVFIESVEALGHDIHVDAGNNAYRGSERYNMDLPLAKNKPAPVLQKAIKAPTEKTQVSSVPRVNTVPAGVTSVASLEPTQNKKRPLDTEARAEKVAKLLASGSSSSSSKSSGGSNSSTSSGSDTQKKSGTVESATTTMSSAPVAVAVAASVKAIKKKQLVDLDALSPSADTTSATYFSDTFGGAEASYHTNNTNTTTNCSTTSSNSSAAQPAKRPRLEVPTRASTTKPMPASFYSNVVPGVPVVRPAEPSRPTPVSAGIGSSLLPPSALVLPSGPAPMSFPTTGNVSPRPYGGSSHGVGVAVGTTAGASTPSYVADRSDIGGAGAVHQHAPRYPDEHRRSASHETDQRDRLVYPAENRPWQNNDTRQPFTSVESRNTPRDTSWDRSTHATSLESRHSDRSKNNDAHELVEGQSVCGYCRGLSKLGSCNNSKHVHGQKLLIIRLKDLGRDAPGRLERETSRSRSSERDPRDRSYEYSRNNNNRDDYNGRERQNRQEAGGKRDRSDSRDRNERRGDRGSGARDRTDRTDLRGSAETHEVCPFCRSKFKKTACRNYKHLDGLLIRRLPQPSYEVPRSDDFTSDRSPRYEESNRATLREPSAAPPVASHASLLPAAQPANEGAGRGRGRSSTLPAWMTAQSTAAGDPVGDAGTFGTSDRTAVPSTTSVHASSDARQENSTIDSWHPTEDDIIICTQNVSSDPHFKRTENWLSLALEQSHRRRRTAAEARLRYTWLCTTGRTQQRLQDPLVIAQIEQLHFSMQQQVAAATAATTTTGVSARQFADAPGPTKTTGGAMTKAGTTETGGDDHTLVDSDDELNTLLGVDSDEEMIKVAKKNSTQAASSVAGRPIQSTTTGKSIVTHNKRMSGGGDSDTESGEVSDDSAVETTSPPPRPVPQTTNTEALQNVTIKFPSQSVGTSDNRILSPSPAPKISAPSVVSAPPPKPSRFASDSNFRVTATSTLQMPRSGGTVTAAPPLNVPPSTTPASAAPAIQTTPAAITKAPSLPVPTLTPSVAPTAAAAPKASRFATDGNFKVTPALVKASAVPGALVTAVAPTAAAPRSTLSIFKAAVSAAAAAESPSASRKSVPVPTLDTPSLQVNVPASTRAPSSSPVQSPAASSDSTGRSSNSPIIIDLENSTELSKKVVVKDEMSLERSKYAKKQHSPSLFINEDSTSVPNKSLAVSKPTTSIGGKWGALMAKPASGVSPRPVDGVNSTTADTGNTSMTHTTHTANNVEVVRLGMREDDPKKRLALSNRHAGGVFAASPRGLGVPATSSNGHTSEAGAPMYSDEMIFIPAVIDLKAMPTKSILRADHSMQGKSTTNSTTTSTGSAAANVVSKKVVWSDTVEGGQLQSTRFIEKAVYTHDLAEETPNVIQLPFLPDKDGGIKVLWNDNDSQSP